MFHSPRGSQTASSIFLIHSKYFWWASWCRDAPWYVHSGTPSCSAAVLIDGQVSQLHFFIHSVEWAAPPSWGNIFLNTSTVMLTPAIACQHDILLGDNGEVPYRIVCQACRQEKSRADQWRKKGERQSCLSLTPSAFDRSSDGACNKLRLNILKRASMTFDVQTFM